MIRGSRLKLIARIFFRVTIGNTDLERSKGGEGHSFNPLLAVRTQSCQKFSSAKSRSCGSCADEPLGLSALQLLTPPIFAIQASYEGENEIGHLVNRWDFSAQRRPHFPQRNKNRRAPFFGSFSKDPEVPLEAKISSFPVIQSNQRLLKLPTLVHCFPYSAFKHPFFLYLKIALEFKFTNEFRTPSFPRVRDPLISKSKIRSPPNFF